MAGLRLSLDAGSKVRLSCDEKFAPTLDNVAGRYATSMRLRAGVVEIDLDDFLSHLQDLTWPTSDVSWDPTLEHLVRTNVQDAQDVQDALGAADALSEPWVDPPGWIAPLTHFQARDTSRLLALSHGANFSVPGAGKTRVGLAVYAARKQRGQVERLLIVAPKSAYQSWANENLDCFGMRPLPMEILQDAPVDCEVLIVNYERLPQMVGQLSAWLRQRPSMLIADEGHRMKRGPRGAYGRAMLTLAPLARHRLILTGTPAPNGVSDLESVLSFAWPGSARARVRAATAGGDLARASQLLRPLFVRTTKSELGLPPMSVRLAEVPLPPLHRQLYDALLGHFRAEAPDLADLGRIVMYLLMAADCPSLIPLGGTRHDPVEYVVPPLDPGRDRSLRDLMRDLPSFETSPKYLAATQIVSQNAELGRKTIVWSTFVRSLNSLGILMRPYRPAIVHGGTRDRDEQLRRFLNDPTCHVLLSNPATLGEGINLHHVSNDAIYVDRDFAAGRFLQSLDRIHRLGLRADARVSVTVLAAAGTIDNVVEQRLSQKLRFMGTILDDPNVQQLADLDEDPDIAAGISAEDAESILRHLGNAPA